jgi:transposase-like protein
MAKHGRSEEKQSFWRMAIELQRESGLSVVKFCEREGLKPATLFAWRRKLAKESPKARPTTAQANNVAANSSPQLVPVRLVDDGDRSSVEVVAPGGFVVRVPEAAGSDNVRRVLQLLHDVR